jgi:hypothetical protein
VGAWYQRTEKHVREPLSIERRKEASRKAYEIAARQGRVAWTPDRRSELLAMRSNGITLRQCAEHFGVSDSRVGQVQRREAFIKQRGW